MSNKDHNITLNVDASGNYSYTGGNDGGNGDVVNKKGGGPANMHVTLEAPSGFNITNVELSAPGINWKIPNGKKVKIDNDCKYDVDVKYSIIVTDTSTGNEIFCDPKIINK
ncbi:MAG: hypothetical protein KA902_02315 [Arenimonas sp.]|nr:hypothetical protein [Arenimonas sp.]